MGKAVTYLSILIFADLFFIATGQICAQGTCTLSSTLFDSLLNLTNAESGGFFTSFIGNASNLTNSGTGILALLTGGGVLITASALISREFRILLIPIAATLALLISDFIIIGSYLLSLNVLLGTFIMGPLIILYIFTALEWLIGKD